jgi:ATP-dependent helicase/nuclease subunit A
VNTAQILAADPQASVWVAASAGTGKTKVLTDRILTLLLHGFTPERILCLTFTKAAASEMANRLMQRLAKWATLSPAELVKELEDLLGTVPASILFTRACHLFSQVLDTPGGMKIQTLHGFCQSILGRFPLEAQIPPHFRILDDLQAREMWARARQAVFQNPSPSVMRALKVLNPLMGDLYFTTLLESFYTYRSRVESVLDKNGSTQNFAESLFKFLKIDSLSLEECLNETLIENQKKQFAPRGQDFESYIRIFLTKEDEIRKNLSEDQVLKAEEIKRFVWFLKGLETARRTLAFVIIFQDIAQSYARQKLDQAVLDYEDLIHKTQNLLAQPTVAAWILYKLDGGIDHLLIDEAQDTSAIQWQIIQSLTSEFFTGSNRVRTFFAVGDAKQSIYSFQGADPQNFVRMRDYFANLVRSNGQTWREVDLDLSYRSTPVVLKVVDKVFALPENRRGVAFDKNVSIRHRPFREHDSGIVELWPLVETSEPDAHKPTEKPTGEWQLPLARIERASPRKMLANGVANHIAHWLEAGEKLPSTGESVQPRDILILLRKRGELGHEIIRALEKRSIPVAGADRLILTDHIAVMDLIALGRFVLLPQDDLNLACLLRSPLISLSEEDLYSLAYEREGALWTALVQKAGEKGEFHQACQWLQDRLYEADIRPVYEFYSHALYSGRGKACFVARLGHEVEDILDEFLTRALIYDQSRAGGLQGFIHLLTSRSPEIKRDTSDTVQNRVRVMTVHGSKGLQSPLVVLPDAADPGSGIGTGKRDALLWGEDFFILKPAGKDDTPQTRVLKAQGQARDEEEYHRLLYVAMTRAQDHLYMGGYARNHNSSGHSWHQMLYNALGKTNISKPEQFIADYSSDHTRRVSFATATAAQPLPGWITDLPSGKEKRTDMLPRDNDVEQAATEAAVQATKGAMERGILIHKFFDYLPSLPKDKRYKAACHLVEKVFPDMQPGLHNVWEEDINKTLQILEGPDFAPIFGPESLSEVPIIGYKVGTDYPEGRAFEARIDRLLVKDQTITIIDYKTDRTVPANLADVPKSYRRQLTTYAEILSAIYPDHQIHKYLLWTQGPLIQEITD